VLAVSNPDPSSVTVNRRLPPEQERPTVAPLLPSRRETGRHNSYRIKKPDNRGIRHDGPATIRLATPLKR
jgi:hypothetical protein